MKPSKTENRPILSIYKKFHFRILIFFRREELEMRRFAVRCTATSLTRVCAPRLSKLEPPTAPAAETGNGACADAACTTETLRKLKVQETDQCEGQRMIMTIVLGFSFKCDKEYSKSYRFDKEGKIKKCDERRHSKSIEKKNDKTTACMLQRLIELMFLIRRILYLWRLQRKIPLPWRPDLQRTDPG